jgi:hypothetical protein
VRRLLPAAALLVLVLLTSAQAAPGDEDTPKAAKTRQVLKTKVTFDWKDTSFGDVIQDIKDQVKIGIIADTKAGVNLNKQMTYSCKDIPFEDALEQLIAKNGWGYYVKSQKGDGYDGVVIIRPGKERGYYNVEGKPAK